MAKIVLGWLLCMWYSEHVFPVIKKLVGKYERDETIRELYGFKAKKEEQEKEVDE